MRIPPITLSLPQWLIDALPPDGRLFPTVEERMHFAIGLARQNVANGGGPFAAAVFEQNSGRLIAPGVNMVVSTKCSAFHAEIVALSFSQSLLGTYDLGSSTLPPLQLVTTTEPCAMCLGAIPWAGVRSVICGARDEDARSIGFDEGAKPQDWKKALQDRGIDVITDICRSSAVQVLRDYAASGGVIYNSRTTDHPKT